MGSLGFKVLGFRDLDLDLDLKELDVYGMECGLILGIRSKWPCHFRFGDVWILTLAGDIGA